MIIERIRENNGLALKIKEGVDALKEGHFFSAALELALIKSFKIADKTDSLKEAAAQRYFHLGYSQALDDLFNFMENFVNSPKDKMVMNFGVLTHLEKRGDITSAEAKKMREDILKGK